MKIKRNYRGEISSIKSNIAKGKSLYGGLLEGNNSQVINIISDSTGAATTSWPYLLAQKIASAYPNHIVKYKLFNYLTSKYNSWTNIQSVGADRYLRNEHFSVPQVNNYHHTLFSDEVSLTDPSGDIDVTLMVSLDDWHSSADRYIIGKKGSYYSWNLEIVNNVLYISWSPTQGASLITKNTNIPISTFTNGTAYWIRVQLTLADANNSGFYTVKGYTSTDGVTWTLAGTTNGTAATTVYSDSTANYYLGGSGSVVPYNSTSDVNANFYEVLIRDGIDGPVANPQPIESWHKFSYSDGNPSGSFLGTPTIYIYNASCPGWGTNDFKVVATLNKAVPKSYGALTFFALGHNDTAKYWNLNGYTADLDTLFNTLNVRALNSTKILLTQNPFALQGAMDVDIIQSRIKIRKTLMAYAQKNNMSIIDTYVEFLKAPQGYVNLLAAIDGEHPTTDGQIVLANAIWNQLKLI